MSTSYRGGSHPIPTLSLTPSTQRVERSEPAIKRVVRRNAVGRLPICLEPVELEVRLTQSREIIMLPGCEIQWTSPTRLHDETNSEPEPSPSRSFRIPTSSESIEPGKGSVGIRHSEANKPFTLSPVGLTPRFPDIHAAIHSSRFRSCRQRKPPPLDPGHGRDQKESSRVDRGPRTASDDRSSGIRRPAPGQTIGRTVVAGQGCPSVVRGRRRRQ